MKFLFDNGQVHGILNNFIVIWWLDIKGFEKKINHLHVSIVTKLSEGNFLLKEFLQLPPCPHPGIMQYIAISGVHC